jgi:hypothetical protein
MGGPSVGEMAEISEFDFSKSWTVPIWVSSVCHLVGLEKGSSNLMVLDLVRCGATAFGSSGNSDIMGCDGGGTCEACRPAEPCR